MISDLWIYFEFRSQIFCWKSMSNSLNKKELVADWTKNRVTHGNRPVPAIRRKAPKTTKVKIIKDESETKKRCLLESKEQNKIPKAKPRHKIQEIVSYNEDEKKLMEEIETHF